MANSTLSPNMNLVVPTVSVDPAPDWANNINASLSIIDEHNHSSGEGVPVPSAGININADLTFNNYNATGLRTVRFQPLSAAPSTGSDIGVAYELNGDLWYNDAAGDQIQITSGNSVVAAGVFTQALLMSQVATPGNPAVGKDKLYFKSDDNLYQLNSSGTEKRISPVNAVPLAPTAQTFTSGTGTYTTPAGVLYIQVTMVGGGGGGGAATSNNGANGVDTTFGGNTAGKGLGGPAGAGNAGGGGGTGTLGAGFTGIAINGGGGGGGATIGTVSGGMGGASALGGGGTPGGTNAVGGNGAANSGGGGAGGGGGSDAGSGGGSGAYVNAFIASPASTYSYAVGGGGNGGAAGTNAGGNGGSGVIIVLEYYQ